MFTLPLLAVITLTIFTIIESISAYLILPPWKRASKEERKVWISAIVWQCAKAVLIGYLLELFI